MKRMGLKCRPFGPQRFFRGIPTTPLRAWLLNVGPSGLGNNENAGLLIHREIEIQFLAVLLDRFE
jgi:hypothetical protein